MLFPYTHVLILRLPAVFYPGALFVIYPRLLARVEANRLEFAP